MHLWPLFPELWNNKGNKHQRTLKWVHKQPCQWYTIVSMTLWAHIICKQKHSLHTWLCNAFLGTWRWLCGHEEAVSDALDINFVHYFIHDHSCKNKANLIASSILVALFDLWDLKIWWMILTRHRVPLLYPSKLCASFHVLPQYAN